MVRHRQTPVVRGENGLTDTGTVPDLTGTELIPNTILVLFFFKLSIFPELKELVSGGESTLGVAWSHLDVVCLSMEAIGP